MPKKRGKDTKKSDREKVRNKDTDDVEITKFFPTERKKMKFRGKTMKTPD